MGDGNMFLQHNTKDVHAPRHVQDHFSLFETPARTSFLQDFHHLDHQFGSSTAPSLGFQTPCYDPFATFRSYTTDTPVNNDLDFFECKPFAENVASGYGNGQVMDNFGFFGFQNRSSMDNIMALENNNPFGFQELKPVNFVVPDEVSSVDVMAKSNNGYNFRKGIDLNKNNTHIRGSSSSKKDWKGRKKPNVIKGQWTIEEDKLLIQLVEQHGIRKWSHIAQMLPGRIGKQCRERWHNHLRPDIKKDIWNDEEDKVLIEAHAEIGNKWAEIAKRLPGRTENSIKNHWNATKRRQYSKRKCRSKYPRGTLLQEYIKSLNLDPNYMTKKNPNNSCSMFENNNNNSNASSSNGSSQQLQPMQGLELCLNTDRLVPDFDFNEVPDFDFNDKLLLQENCSIDSLLDEFPSAQVATDDEEKRLLRTGGSEDSGGGLKKELDSVEMLSPSDQNNGSM